MNSKIKWHTTTKGRYLDVYAIKGGAVIKHSTTTDKVSIRKIRSIIKMLTFNHSRN